MTKKILVVDDEEIITKTLQKLIKKEGYDVETAKSGKEALEKIKQKDFDLLIVDVRMPEMDGIETIKKIREYLKQSNKQQIPEIVITGYADLDKYQEGTELEVTDYLSKPFDNQDFLKIVKKTIG